MPERRRIVQPLTARTATLIAIFSTALSLALGGMLAWVLVDPQRWFGDDFAAKPSATADEKELAVAAALENADAQCRAYQEGTCDRELVGAERLASGLWRIVLARDGFRNWCLNAHVASIKASVTTIRCGSP
jgi:hypothetical protein